MKILIIGGTRFVGRHFAELALAKGHELTLFNRGKSNPSLFDNVEYFTGSRDADLSNLPAKNRQWDCVLDTCGYVPRIVKKSCDYLKNSVKQYVFVSTISVYADFSKSGINEDSELSRTDDPNAETVTNENYGPLKVLCEKAVTDVYGNNALIIRPGLIVGPHDPTDRFTYWPVRIQKGGDVMAPAPSAAPNLLIDGRVLAIFMLSMMGKQAGGVFNATGPEWPLTRGEFLNTCNEVTGNQAKFTWVSDKFLEDNNCDLPGSMSENWYGIEQIDCRKGIKHGLRFRRLDEIIRDTLAWHYTRPADYALKVGLKPEIETELLRKWRETNRSYES
jgi:2'-hydroxyisoflavone reductase